MSRKNEDMYMYINQTSYFLTELFYHSYFQFTEEKLGQAEKTEYDAHFENLLTRADNTRMFTEKLLENSKGVLQPNPSK